MNFLRNVLATLVGLALFFMVGTLVSIGILTVLTSEQKMEVEDNAILHLKLDLPISELEVDDPLAALPAFGGAGNTIGLVQLLQVIRHAKEDAKIKGIFLDAPYVNAGFSTVAEIHAALKDFATSGKFVTSYAEHYSEGAYVLSSSATELYMHPEGGMEFNGLSIEVLFLKGLFDKLEIEPQIFRVGEYKSAVETFFREDMSEENELQLTEAMNSIYHEIVDKVARSRDLSYDKVDNISRQMLVRNPQDALALGMVDSLYYMDQLINNFKRKLGLKEDDEINLVTYKDYKKSFSTYKRSDNEIAVIVADGDIVSGEGEIGNVGSEKFAKEIRKARKDDDVKAIVIRVNSPGGSFIASDVMWNEIFLASKTKPVIASMGDYAASGGYYLSMACDTIVAQPNTITGSIGIFGIIFNMQSFLDHKLGVTFDRVQTGEVGNLYTATRPLTDLEKSIVQKDIEEGYETFTSKAAAGRGMHIDSLKKIASGRVWTGTQALEVGLVDRLGDLQDALEIAVEKAGVADDYKVKYYPKQKPLLDRILEDLNTEAQNKLLKKELGDLYPYIHSIKKLQHYRGLQARMPIDLEIKY